MGLAQNEHPQYEMTKACTCPDGRCVCGKTHFADGNTIAYIARLEAELALTREALEKLVSYLWGLEPATSDNGCYTNDPNELMARKALSTLTTGNAVQQIEARAYEKAASKSVNVLRSIGQQT